MRISDWSSDVCSSDLKLTEKDGRSMIRFFPETGRTHQIRAHALYGLGAAIVGDPVYGGGTPAPMLLHSHFLSLKREGKPPVEATAPLPERFAAAGFGPEYLNEGKSGRATCRERGGKYV